MTATITTIDVFAIFLQIVKDYPYSKCTQPRTFATLTNEGGFFSDKFLTENLEKTKNDYKNGFFWARDWVNGGANPNKLKKEYPIVGIENRSIEFEDLTRRYGNNEFHILVADRYDCDDCEAQCKRTIDQISLDTQQIMFNIIREFNQYAHFEWEIAAVPYSGWLSRGRAEYLVTNALVDPNTMNETGVDIVSVLEFEPVRFVDWGLHSSTYDKALGWALRFKINECLQETVTFDYSKTAPAEIGTTKCETC